MCVNVRRFLNRLCLEARLKLGLLTCVGKSRSTSSSSLSVLVILINHHVELLGLNLFQVGFPN